MAIAHDNTAGNQTSWGSSLSWAHATAGSDKYLVVGVAIRSSSITIDSVTHNGNSLTQLDSHTNSGGMTQALFYMVNPDATGNVVVTTSAAIQIAAVSNSYTGVDQTTPHGTTAKASSTTGTSISVNLTSATGELCIDVESQRNSENAAPDSGQTARGEQNTGFLNTEMSEEAGAGSVTMGWSWTSSHPNQQIGVPLKPASGGGGGLSMPVAMHQYRRTRGN